MTTTTENGATAMTIATELHHVAHLGHDVYEQCPACRAAMVIGMGATVAAVIYGGGNADTLVKWVGTFTTMSEADAYCQTKADAYPGMSVLIVDEFGSYDDGRISPLATPAPMADQTTEDAAPTAPTDPRPTTPVTNDQGVTFHARLIRTGERYGLVDKLTNDGAAMVEFFDAEADPAKFGPLGQFVSRYYVDTFNETAEDGRGIALEGSVPRWTITAANVAEVAAWLASLNAVDQRYEADPYTPDDGPKWTPGQPMPLTLALAIDGCPEVDVIEMALAVCQDELRRLTAPDRDPGYFLTYEDEEGDPNWLVGPFATDADRREFAKAHPADAMPVTMYGPTNMTPDTPADFLAEMAEIAASDADWQAL